MPEWHGAASQSPSYRRRDLDEESNLRCPGPDRLSQRRSPGRGNDEPEVVGTGASQPATAATRRQPDQPDGVSAPDSRPGQEIAAALLVIRSPGSLPVAPDHRHFEGVDLIHCG